MLKVITGPTGSGKSEIAEGLLLENERIFNADSFQFYREIPILSNQSRSQRTDFLAWRSISEPITAGEFGRWVMPYLGSEGIWVGTGLYLGAALYGLDEPGKKGTPFQKPPRKEFKAFVIMPKRDTLYDRLNARVDEMLDKGALKEAEAIFKLRNEGKIEGSNPILKAIGLNHLLQFLDLKMNWNECLRLWKRDTRRLAKRQGTWLRGFFPPSETVQWTEESPREILSGRGRLRF